MAEHCPDCTATLAQALLNTLLGESYADGDEFAYFTCGGCDKLHSIPVGFVFQFVASGAFRCTSCGLLRNVLTDIGNVSMGPPITAACSDCMCAQAEIDSIGSTS